MRTKICEMVGCDVPIFAFSHCRDVVVEATRAGGFGVLGSSIYTPAELEQELKWIDDHVDGRSYGVDVLMNRNYDKAAAVHVGALSERVPEGHRQFIEAWLDTEGVPPLTAEIAAEIQAARADKERNLTMEAASLLVDVALRHPQVKMLVSALGAPEPELVAEIHSRGMIVGALCGKASHARSHRAAGVDVLIAQGAEAGGHTGTISTMVLLPQIVDEAGDDMVVLAAGGISRGSQVAAALAMGAQGVWCGSIWLGTRESDLLPYQKEALFAASSEDAVQSRAMTGKPVRLLDSKYVRAWQQPDAPKTLPAPLQKVLYRTVRDRVDRVSRGDLYSGPVGQVVGVLTQETTVRGVMYDLQEEYIEALGRLAVQFEGLE